MSLGVDAAEHDPAAPLMITPDAFRATGRALARLDLPTVFVQEGGYDLPRLVPLVLDEVQQALVTFGGTQCGICTPGIALCASAALTREPDADRPRLRELLAGNLCRCTGYQLIIDALVDAASTRRERSKR